MKKHKIQYAGGERWKLTIPGYAYNGRSLQVLQARWIVMKALGKSLPQKARVHHVNGDTLNDISNNLVACEDESYHKLLHLRTEALRATGNPHSRCCMLCKEWGVPGDGDMVVYRQNKNPKGNGRARHKSCHREREKERRQSMKRYDHDHETEQVYLRGLREYQKKCVELEKDLAFYRSRPPLSSTMIYWAFKYCVKCSTFAVMDCVDYLLLYWDRIEERIRKKIIEELFEECGKKGCMIEMDKSQWLRVLARGRGGEKMEEELYDWPCQDLHGGRGSAIYDNIDGRCKHPECHPRNDDRKEEPK